MTTSPVTATSANAANALQFPEPEEASSSAETLASDFDTFLTLLTAELQNQDPLNPVDSTEYVTQLAMFSIVEQSVATNDQLADTHQVISDDSGAALARWIGLEAETSAPVRFDGEPIEIAVAPGPGATSAALVIRDASGAVKGRAPVDAAAGAVTWDGATQDGTVLPEDSYTFQVEYTDADGEITTEQGYVYAPVTEIRLSTADPEIILAGGSTVLQGDVRSVRQPTPVEES